jgi:hypothetical protein
MSDVKMIKSQKIDLRKFKLADYNPRDIADENKEALSGSLEKLGMLQDLCVNKRTGNIFGGNQRARILLEKGVFSVQAKVVDWPLEKEKAANLALNNPSSQGFFTDLGPILKDVQTELPDFYTDLGLDALEFLSDMDGDLEDEEEDDSEPLDEVSDQLPGVAAFKDDIVFPSELPYGMPEFLPNMLGDLPAEIRPWVGPRGNDPEYDGWWWFNWRADSTRGADHSKFVMGFYIDDFKFAQFAATPAKSTARLVNLGIKIAIAPNFSMLEGQPLAVAIYQVYKARWVARYFQEAGIQVIPDVYPNRAYPNGKTGLPLQWIGLPKNAPMFSVQTQSWTGSTDDIASAIDEIDERFSPGRFVLYGNTGKGEEIIDALTGVDADRVVLVAARSQAKYDAGVMPNRDNKKFRNKEVRR